MNLGWRRISRSKTVSAGGTNFDKLVIPQFLSCYVIMYSNELASGVSQVVTYSESYDIMQFGFQGVIGSIVLGHKSGTTTFDRPIPTDLQWALHANSAADTTFEIVMEGVSLV